MAYRRPTSDYVPHALGTRAIAEADFEDELPSNLHPESAYPLGSNRLPLVANFNQRLRYKNGKYFEGLPKPIDTLYDKVFYGKVDRLQNVIVPRLGSDTGAPCATARLKQISEKNVFALDFVADNFFLFRRNMKIAADEHWIESHDTNLSDIEGVGGWFNYKPLYRKLFENLIASYNNFLYYSLPKTEFNGIKTFEDYAVHFQQYVLSEKYRGPITLTEMILTYPISPRISGLAIEIEKKSYSSDLPKYIEYFEDVNFSYYVRAARKFGFYVDKNGPWRLFADVFSPPMLKILREDYSISENEIFNTYYTRTYTLDLGLLRTGLRDAWNKFADKNNRIIVSVSDTGAGCAQPYFRLQGGRATIGNNYLWNLSDMFWYRLYINVRSAESGIIYKNKDFLAREAVNVKNAYGDPHGLLYINNLFKPYMYDERLFKKHLTSADDSVIVGSVLDAPTVYVGL